MTLALANHSLLDQLFHKRIIHPGTERCVPSNQWENKWLRQPLPCDCYLGGYNISVRDMKAPSCVWSTAVNDYLSETTTFANCKWLTRSSNSQKAAMHVIERFFSPLAYTGTTTFCCCPFLGILKKWHIVYCPCVKGELQALYVMYVYHTPKVKVISKTLLCQLFRKVSQ